MGLDLLFVNLKRRQEDGAGGICGARHRGRHGRGKGQGRSNPYAGRDRPLPCVRQFPAFAFQPGSKKCLTRSGSGVRARDWRDSTQRACPLKCESDGERGKRLRCFPFFGQALQVDEAPIHVRTALSTMKHPSAEKSDAAIQTSGAT